jgi:hypothetical protein
VPYVPFRPVFALGDELVVSDEPPSPDFARNLQRVLSFYGVPWTTRDGDVLVPASVWRDRDTCWNYTSKANDEVWLRTHA